MHDLVPWQSVVDSNARTLFFPSNDAILKNPQLELTRISNELEDRCDLESRSLLLDKMSNFVDNSLQHGVLTDESVRGGDGADACVIPPYKRPSLSSRTKAATADADPVDDELLIATETEVYEKAMQVFCDMNNRKAFGPNYVWPVLNS
jgi:hypothetical protein